MSIMREKLSFRGGLFGNFRTGLLMMILAATAGCVWQFIVAPPAEALFRDQIWQTDTASPTTFAVPFDGTYRIDVWGARGGATFLNTDCSGGVVDGGWGAYSRGNITLTKGTNLFLYRGGKGTNGGCAGTGSPSGGAIGGGAGSSDHQRGGGGGGGSDVRLTGGTWNNSGSLASRIMVAGGGAGASNYTNSATGGYGGTLAGAGGVLNSGNAASCLATGGSQIAGGNGGGGPTSCTAIVGSPGTFGIGGASQSNNGSGGGGGYYGGGGGGSVSGGVSTGAGGSSYVSGCTGCNSVTSATNLAPSGSNIHYSGRSFSTITMTAGNGTRPNVVGFGSYPDESGAVRIQLVSYGAGVASTPGEFRCTGAAQTYTASATGTYQLEVWGAQGAGNTLNKIAKGAYAKGYYAAARNSTMNVYVGCAGAFGTTTPVPGGFNGGGAATAPFSDGNNGSGGGASDIRIGGTALTNRRIVAGGGGGSIAPNDTAPGHGGAATGIAGQNLGMTGNGGTQSAGGTATDGATAQTGAAIGSSGQGGQNSRAGGGGGYFGGGAAPYVGGGGSSYVGGVTAWIGNPTVSTAGNASMPDPISTANGTMTGNLGDGYARIRLMTVNMTATAISPNTVDINKTQTVTITGTNFSEASVLTGGAITVTIGGAACTGVAVVSATSLTCTAPARATAGPVNVVVANALGDSSTLTNAYTYREFLYLTVADDTVSMTIDTSTGGFAQDSTDVSVQSSSADGYVLSIRAATDTNLVCTSTPSAKFGALTSDGTLSNGKWGWNVGSAPGENGTWRAIKLTDANNGGFMSDGLVAYTFTASGPADDGTVADNYTMWFGARADRGTLACDSYKTQVIFTAVQNPLIMP